jgi:glycine/D-amino acid oxidase-like deaminating enzyme
VRPAAPSPVYVDGAYVISEAGEATTWAVCDHGRWGVIYQCSGAEILSAWVESDDLPLHVLAEALREVER